MTDFEVAALLTKYFVVFFGPRQGFNKQTILVQLIRLCFVDRNVPRQYAILGFDIPTIPGNWDFELTEIIINVPKGI